MEGNAVSNVLITADRTVAFRVCELSRNVVVACQKRPSDIRWFAECITEFEQLRPELSEDDIADLGLEYCLLEALSLLRAKQNSPELQRQFEQYLETIGRTIKLVPDGHEWVASGYNPSKPR